MMSGVKGYQRIQGSSGETTVKNSADGQLQACRRVVGGEAYTWLKEKGVGCLTFP